MLIYTSIGLEDSWAVIVGYRRKVMLLLF